MARRNGTVASGFRLGIGLSLFAIALIGISSLGLLPGVPNPFETSAVATSTLPFYELSVVPMLTALLRYLLVLERGGGAAPEEVFASDRVLQLLGLLWIVVYGVAVYAN